MCGKLLTIRPSFDLPDKQLVDSTGIYFTPMLRHLDRGSQEVDNGHYLNFEYVFGATAAAALYRRQMIDDISIEDEFFDPDFFVYREDADVAWRAQLMGWRCIYTPTGPRLSRPQRAARKSPGAAAGDQHALGEESLPDAHQEHDAGSVPAQLVVHHLAGSGGAGRLPAARTLLAQALSDTWLRNWRRVWASARRSCARRRAKDDYIASWFSYEPVSRPAAGPTARALAKTGGAR